MFYTCVTNNLIKYAWDKVVKEMVWFNTLRVTVLYFFFNTRKTFQLHFLTSSWKHFFQLKSKVFYLN